MKQGSIIVLLTAAALGQAPSPQPASPVEFTCPMDPDVRAKGPGKCPRCGMTLEARIQEPVEYRLAVQAVPPSLPAQKPVELLFEFIDPRTNQRATKFEYMHEKLLHLFVVSADLEYFAHIHPVPQKDGSFRLATTLPKPGIYKLLTDAYPAGGTPQLLPKFLTTAGYEKSIGQSITTPPADLAPKKLENLEVKLRTDPPQPTPGRKTMLFFDVSPAKGLEPYLGAMGHLLAVSNDLVDSIHEHPFLVNGVEGGKALDQESTGIQFNIYFPREATYRIWVQFQRDGVVNTAQFTLPVKSL